VVSFLVDTSRDQAAEGEPSVNIIVDLSNANEKPNPITLSLRDVSMADALDFVCDISGLQVDYSRESAIVLYKERPPASR